MGNQGDSSGELTRATARAYVRATKTLQGPKNTVQAPAFSFADVKRTRAAAFSSAELPDVPFGGIALTPAEKKARIDHARLQLAESSGQMKALIAHERELAESSRTTGQAIGMTVVAASVVFLSFALAYLSHLGAVGLLDL